MHYSGFSTPFAPYFLAHGKSHTYVFVVYLFITGTVLKKDNAMNEKSNCCPLTVVD